jgi:hypothetical protein
VAADRQIESKTRHPLLGPGVAIHDNRSRTRLRFLFYVALLPLSAYGLFMGHGDIATGSTLLGVAQIAAALVVALYSIRAVVVDAQHLANPIRLVVARDGFELAPRPHRIKGLELFPCQHPISWDEVATIGDRKYPDTPRTLRLQIDDPQGFADRQALAPFARLMLTVNRGDLVLGSGMAMSIARLEDLMRRHLADFRREASPPASKPARTREPRSQRLRKR